VIGRTSLAALMIFVSFTLHAQTKVPSSGGTSSILQVQKQLSDVQSELVALRQKVTTLDTALKFDEYLLKNKQERQESIALNLVDHTFQRLDTDSGFFLISVKDVVPYLNGFKIHLNIGNPLSAGYSGFKVKVRWAKAYDYAKYTEASMNEWQKGIQEKETSLVDVLDAGTWNNVDVIVAPATTEQLGFVTLSMSVDTVRLITK
jgi:hypothetical protein